MKKILKNEFAANELTAKICDVLGISPENVNVNHVKSDDGNSELIECSISLEDSDEDEVADSSTFSEMLQDQINQLKNDESFKNLSKAWKNLVKTVVNAAETVKGKSDADEVCEDATDSCYCGCCDDSECGETHCCNCGTPCCVEDCCEEEHEESEMMTTAMRIKEDIRKKFNAVIESQAHARARQNFYQELKDELLKKCVLKIKAGEYQSLTNDVDDDGAGIGILLSEEVTTNIEIPIRKKYCFNDEMDWEYLETEVLCGLAHEIAVHTGFSESIGYVDDQGRTYIKLWF